MSANVICNICKQPVKYIVNSREGTQKCDPTPLKGVTARGRILEVYLIHECDKAGASNKIHKNENENRDTREYPTAH